MNTAEQQRVVDEIKAQQVGGSGPRQQTAMLGGERRRVAPTAPRRPRRADDVIQDIGSKAARFAFDTGASFSEASRKFDISISVVDRYFGKLYPGVSKAGRFRK